MTLAIPTTTSSPNVVINAVLPTTLSNDQPADYVGEALRWHKFGFDVIPLVPNTKRPTLSWEPWFTNLSPENIEQYWTKHLNHEVAFKVGEDLIVFDTDSQASTMSLWNLEKEYGCPPYMVVSTAKGEHHYFRIPQGVYARADSHDTQTYPDRIDVKTGRALITLPPSTGKTVRYCYVKCAKELNKVDQDFIDAIFKHNGRVPPRPIENATYESDDNILPDEKLLIKLPALLNHIDPDIGYEDWLHILMAIHHETNGSEEGFEIADAWCGRGNKYQGSAEIRAKWRSFKSNTEKSFNIGTLINMVKAQGIDTRALLSEAEEPFDICETTVHHIGLLPKPTTLEFEVVPASLEISTPKNKFDQYSLKGMSAELEKCVVDDVLLLGQVALLGQATVFFAAPNTGKTAITLKLLIDSITSKRIDPSKIYYLNMDDSSKGLLEKNRIAEEYGFHLLAEGHRDFSAAAFKSILRDMIENDQAKGIVLVLDTLKKFVNLMDKNQTSAFTNVIRPFVSKGGTVIALAHTNKNPDKSGNPVYGGVSDIMSDIDCAYTIAQVSAENGVKAIEFVNIKRRGNVVQNASYSYSIENKISYHELLTSIQPVDDSQMESLKLAQAIKSDAEVITFVASCITEGICSKMRLADEVGKRAHISKQSAIKVIEKYTGNNSALHKWTYSVKDRGAKVYVLLNVSSSQPELNADNTDTQLHSRSNLDF